MTETVICLTIYIDIDETPHSVRLLEGLTEWTHRHLRHLQELHIQSPIRGDHFLQPIARLVSGFSCLRVVDLPCQPISHPLFGALGALPHLEKILVDCDVDDEFSVRDFEKAREEEISVSMDRLSLAKLRTVCLGAVSIYGLIHLIEDVHFSAASLTTIWVQIGIGATINPLELRMLLQLMASEFRSLETLHIRFKQIKRRGGDSYFDVDEPLHIDDILAFTDIPTLLHFSIDHPLPILAEFHDIHLLASRCGRFESIWLNPCPSRVLGHQLLTLSALTPFAVFCPRLRRLGLCMDCSLGSHFFLGSAQFARLQEIFVGSSLLNATLQDILPERCHSIAEYLSSILPPNCLLSCTYDFELDGIDTFARRSQSTTRRDWRDEKDWSVVQSMLRVLQRARIEFESDVADIRFETRVLENAIEGDDISFMFCLKVGDR